MIKKQLLRFTLSAIIIYLTGGTLTPAVAATQPSGGNGTHFCGVIDSQWDKRYSDQYPNRRYARTLAANLNVGEPRTLRLIYLLPNDRPYRAEAVQRMKDEIIKVQTFFAEQMGMHGYGEVPFRIETDSQGKPMVHRVDGGHPSSYYLATTSTDEIERAFNLNANIYHIILDAGYFRGHGGRLGKNAGFSVLPDGLGWDTTAHELGHAFGLRHDFRDGTYIMSYGSGPYRLSACHAEFLSVHPYFNPDTPTEEGEPPTIELISPRTYPAESQSVPVQLKVSDLEGLHQVRFSGVGLHTCRGLASARDALVEFEYDGGFGLDDNDTMVYTSLSDSAAHPIYVDAVDTEGNVSYTFFYLVEISPSHIATLEGHTDRVRSVSFSLDGTLATGSGDGTIRLWDVAARQNITTLRHGDRVLSVSFSPDGTLASGSEDGTVKLWDVVTQQDIATLEGHAYTVWSVSFSRDGSTLATGSGDGTVKLWDVAARQNITTLRHGGWVLSVSFSPDGTLASGWADGTVKLWDVAARQNITTLEGHGNWVQSVSFSRDGSTLATGSGDGTVKLWDVAARQNITTLMHGGTVSSVSFSHDATTLASGGWDGTVKLWDVATGANFATLPHTSRVHSVAFSPGGTTLASGTEDRTVELWDMSGLMEVRLEAVAEIDLPDPNLRAAIATTLGKPPSAPIVRGNMPTLTRLDARNANISDLTGLEGATNLRKLDLSPEYVEAENRFINSNSVSDISPLTGLTKLRSLFLGDNNISDISTVAGLTKLTRLHLWNNNISDISAVAALTNLTSLWLQENNISDISPLVANAGLGSGDTVNVWGNLLSYQSIHTHIPTLQQRGVTVEFNNRAHPALLKISGDNQKGAAFASLSQPFVVEVQDENGSALAGISVTFAVTAGGGTLSTTITTTDENGRAQSTLILGPNLGTNTVEVSAAGIESTATFYAIADTELPPLTADVNNDGLVNVLDLIVIASSFGKSGQNEADVNGDGIVSILDLVLAAGTFEEAAAAPSAQPQVPETLTAVDVQGWLTDARALEAKDPIMKRGFVALEQLLVFLTPSETELLPNYPNPFNPETWIPYRLAEDAFVTLTIYDGAGQVVRTLDVGHQIAAVYENRSKAIYWDGRNGLGEGVASGVYFYHLSAGDYSATRKMVILK